MLCFLKTGFIFSVLLELLGGEQTGSLMVSETLRSNFLAAVWANSDGGSLFRGHVGMIIQQLQYKDCWFMGGIQDLAQSVMISCELCKWL
jgi:hypothetical protein